MSEHYDFHYQPTGSGAISGQQVLKQTEDAINELGDYVNDNVGGAMDVAQQALETAQNAETNAQTALDTANSFSGAIQSAQQDASTALSTAQTAQTTASNANNTAIQASQDASSAVTTANNASGQVSTLSGTVTALGQRVTTAEGNIGQNTSDITALTTRVGTAEGNITTLQNDVSIAQGNASSAMATAGTVKQQSYVLRYSSTAVTDNSTIAFSTLDNTDNIKSGDKVIDVDGKIFSVVSVDTANQTVTVGSALIDLALDANVVHTSGNETVGGNKTFSEDIVINNSTSQVSKRLIIRSSKVGLGDSNSDTWGISFNAGSSYAVLINSEKSTSSIQGLNFTVRTQDASNNLISASYRLRVYTDGTAYLTPVTTDYISFGANANRWKEVHALNYYYGSDNTEFSTKFVTTDTAQTITETKTFTNTIKSQKEIEFTGNRLVYILPEFAASYSGLSLCTYGSNGAVKIGTWKVDDNDNTKHVLDASLGYLNVTTGSVNSVNSVYLTPRNSTNSKLGDSTNKWATINGLEPSALGMPVAPSSTSYVDISSYITVLDSSSANTYTPPSNGYITFSVIGNLVQIFHNYGLQGKWTVQAGNANHGFIPVLGGVEVKIYLIASNVDKFWFIPCQGNV